jgi:copper(I)-binding protein
MSRLFAALALTVLAALPIAAIAVDSPIIVSGAWARPTLRGTRTGAAYMTLTNRGQVTDRLVSLSTPVADRAELHEEMMSGGVMSMKPVADLTLRPGTSVQIDPGHYHVMLVGLTMPLVAGESFSLSLTFEKAGAIVVTVPVTTMPPH